MKKIINTCLVAIILSINILVPIQKVHAVETETSDNIITDAQEIIREEMAPIIGKIVAGSQGGSVDNTETFATKMNDLGNLVIDNALANGKRLTDLVLKHGSEIMFNPQAILDIVPQAWNEFAGMELTWANKERVYIDVGAHYTGQRIMFREYADFVPAVAIYYSITGVEYLHFRTINLDGTLNGKSYFTFGAGSNRSHATSTLSGIEFEIDNSGYNRTIGSLSHIIIRPEFPNIDRINQYTHVPFAEVPPEDEIIQNYSSTYSLNEDTPDNQWLSIPESTFIDESITINDTYITNNYSTVIYEGDSITNNYEADEEGGGSFWGALLDLIGTLISTIGGLAESIIGAISGIAESIIDLLANALTPSDNYFQQNFTEIKAKADEKAPNFEPVMEVMGAFQTNDVPAEWEGITVNIPAFNINNITIVDSLVIDRYGRQIKTWIRMILLLMTSLVLIKRVSQVMNK